MIYGRRNLYGSLAAFNDGLGEDRPADVIRQTPSEGYRRQPSHPQTNDRDKSAQSTSLMSRMRTVSKGQATARRAGIANGLRHRRQSSLATPTYRSSFTTDHAQLSSVLTSSADDAQASFRPRASLPPTRQSNGAGAHRLARSAHLHSIGADRMGDWTRKNVRENTHVIPSAVIDEHGVLTPRGVSPQADSSSILTIGPIASRSVTGQAILPISPTS